MRQDLKERQVFTLSDGTRPWREVLRQTVLRGPRMTQVISKVAGRGDGAGCRYIYEEIENETDRVLYARYTSPVTIMRHYDWAAWMLTCWEEV